MKLSGLEKRFLALTLALAMVLCLMPATKKADAAADNRMNSIITAGTYQAELSYYHAQDYDGEDKNDKTSGDYRYRDDGEGNAVITGYNGTAKKVEIPEKLDGKPVICIWGAFKDNKNVTDVALPKSVTMIQYEAFSGAENLTNINLENVQKIGELSFESCNKLGDITLNAESISYHAFRDAHLKSVTIMKDIDASGYIDADKVIFGDEVTKIPSDLFYYADDKTEIVWGKNISTIGSYAFYHSQITSLTIPDSVTELQYNVCSYSQIKDITFSKNLVKVPGSNYGGSMYASPWYDNQKDGPVYTGSVFYSYKGNMPDNTTVTVKAGTKGIADEAFSNYENEGKLVGVKLPDGLLYIGGNAFAYTGLKSIDIPNTVEEIGGYAFYDVKNLKSVVIPKTVKKIGEMAFGYYYDMENYTYLISEGFTIIGYKGSEGERYAKDNGIKFVVAKDGIFEENGELVYYRNNAKASNVTEVVKDSKTGKWYNIVKGKVVGGPTAAKNSSGWWYIGKDGKVDFSYSGLVKYNGSWWYVKNGKLDFSYTGLAKYNGIWWYCKGGKVDFSYTGLAKYNGSWWYVKGGKLDFSYTGLAKYNGSWWYVKSGKVDFSYTGLCKYSGSWWYVKSGKVNFGYTGLCRYNGSWWYVKSGKVNFSYNSLCKYNGSWWYVKGGKVDFSYNGKVKYNGGTFNVKKGKVVF